MGGLRKYMPITYWTMVIGALSLAGFPLFSGFWSKDEILGRRRTRAPGRSCSRSPSSPSS